MSLLCDMRRVKTVKTKKMAERLLKLTLISLIERLLINKVIIFMIEKKEKENKIINGKITGRRYLPWAGYCG